MTADGKRVRSKPERFVSPPEAQFAPSPAKKAKQEADFWYECAKGDFDWTCRFHMPCERPMRTEHLTFACNCLQHANIRDDRPVMFNVLRYMRREWAWSWDLAHEVEAILGAILDELLSHKNQVIRGYAHWVLRMVRSEKKREIEWRARQPMHLVDLNADVLGKIYEHVALPRALKLTCRALRDAGPKRTKMGARHLVPLGIEAIKWACRLGYNTKGKDFIDLAAYHGRLDVLKWAVDYGLGEDVSGRTCSVAAKGGHLAVLKWLRSYGCPWDRRTWLFADLGGHMEVLQWLRDNGCEWAESACWGAVRNGHLEVLQWARANGCPWDKEKCLSVAKKHRHDHVVAWICEQHP